MNAAAVLMMPGCGLSFADVSLAAMECGGSLRRTARRLGVGERSLYAAVKREGLERWFAGRHAPRPRQRCITREQIVGLAREGYTRRDTAYLLGISAGYLKDLIALWDLADEFEIRKGRAAWVTRRGYC